MARIYYDVTHLVSWKGGLTGIPRTTDEIGIRLRNRSDIAFVSWDTILGSFIEIDIDYYYDVVAPQNRSFFKDIKKSSDSVKNSERPLHRKIATRVLVEIPFLARTVHKVRRMRSGNDKKGVVDSRLYKGSAKIGEKDTIFIPCGVWDDKKYIKTLQAVKASGGKVAFVCYDLLPIVVPQFSGQWGEPMKDFTRKITSVCDVVFAISEHTKSDLCDWLKKEKLPVPNVEVIRLGDAYKLSTPKAPTDTKFIDAGLTAKHDFILCTGTVESRKNHTLLYYAYKLARSRGIKLPKLVVVGRPGHRTENIIDIIQDDPDTKEDIILLFDTSDQELSWLYQNCRFTIYPSFYEGWGLPIAESIANGVPCISSNTSSMTEVATEYVRYFNPMSADECLAAILEYMDDATLNDARKKAKKYKPVSWDVTYSQVDATLTKLSK